MKKSLHINLRAHFGAPVSGNVLSRPKPQFNIRQADEQYFRKGDDWVVAQEFDGKNGYLYGYQLQLQQTVSLPIRIDMGDLYVIYIIEGTTDILIRNAATDPVCTLTPRRARYLYVPPGEYQTELSAGEYQVFGLYFDGGIFRDGNERGFRFLHNVIDGYRNRGKSLIHSIDFPVGPRTRRHIQHFCDNLKKGDFDNEAFVFAELSRLVQLSKIKIQEEYEQIDAAAYLVDHAIKLIEAYVRTQGQSFSILDVADDLGVSSAHLCHVFKRKMLPSPKRYKDRYLLERCQKELLLFAYMGDVAERCGFSSVAAFCRFFKNQTGQTVGEYKNRLY